MNQVCHSLISMFYKQLIHIDPVHEFLYSAAVHHDAVDRVSDIYLMKSSDSDE